MVYTGLGVFDRFSGPQIEQRKMKIIKSFKECRLSILVASNITSVDFFDLTLNLKTEFCQMFRELNDDPIYVDINSNHPP